MCRGMVCQDRLETIQREIVASVVAGASMFSLFMKSPGTDWER